MTTIYYLILKDGSYATGDFKPEGAVECPPRPDGHNWDGSNWVETDEWKSTKYKRDRANEYPSWKDQLDDIYHNGIDGWKATIKIIKDKYPK